MSHFFWSSGHLGWGIFALIVFSGLWCLLADLIWRLVATRARVLAFALSVGWVAGVALILLGFHLAGR